jgi:transcriptional regulator NrdR family protein
MEVRKKSGSTEVFMPEKVVVSAVKCGCPYDTAREIASSLSARKESTIESTEIREYVLSELRSRDAASAADAWEAYDREKKSRGEVG